MFRQKSRSIVPAADRRAFTLIELLVVIAIIAMLIGIIMPGLSQARDQARRVATRGTMKAIGDSLEVFIGENEDECRGQSYPPSGGGIYYDDPTEEGGAPVDGQVPLGQEQIFGSQWIVRYLMGKNLDGYVAARNVPSAFNEVAEDGWRQKSWYGSGADGEEWPDYPKEPLPRVGPYMNNPPIKAPRDLQGGAMIPTEERLLPKYSNWVFVDTFGTPILYYAAKSGYANRPDAIQTTYGHPDHVDNSPGIYNWRDNALFTGMTTADPDTGAIETEGNMRPWDFGAGPHKLTFGPPEWRNEQVTGSAWRQAKQRVDLRKAPFSFAYQILNKQAFETSVAQQGTSPDMSKVTIIPARRDSYILWSPGKDTLFGTADDVLNW